MTCHDCRPHLSPWLDGELAAPEHEPLQAHLAECPDCRAAFEELRALDGLLRRQLPPRDLTDFAERIERSLPASPVVPAGPPAETAPPRRSARWGGVLLTALLLVILAVVLRPLPPAALPPEQQLVDAASLTYAVGTIEVRHPGEARWSTVPAGTPTELVEGSRVRTPDQCLCELQTSCEGTLRLNEQTEVVIHVQERVELVRGKLWAQAARQCALDIELQPAAPDAAPRATLSRFLCPSSSEMQWCVQGDSTTCLSLTSPTVEMTRGTEPISIDKGKAMEIADGRVDALPESQDLLVATSWQMPLLVQKSPDDGELQSRLDALLTVIGETKASYLYERQIRELGPAATIPLLAYVRSPKSQDNPQRRRRAMDLALLALTSEQVDRLVPLLDDPDPTIRERAEGAFKGHGPRGKKL